MPTNSDAVTPGSGSLFDTSLLDLPSTIEMVESSMWLDELPGLKTMARRWADEVPVHTASLTGKARHLARPTVDSSMVGALGRTAAHLVVIVALDLIDAMGTASPTGGGHDQAGTSRQRAGQQDHSLKRIESLVRAGGPAWVKLGQFIATSGGLLPDHWVESFEWCRDEVKPLPPRVPRRIVERAFRRDIDDLFSSFEDHPLGAASIAQVHGAVLHDGREVVVKIRRPGLRQRFKADIRAMAGAARAAERLSPVARTGNVSGFVELFAQLVLEELDFRIEAFNMVELGVAAEHAGADYVRFPRPVPGMVTERVLVMERLPGVAYTSAPLDEVDGDRLLRLAIEGILEHTLVYGVFHGDLHAGNVLIDRLGNFSLVDFGIVGRLDQEQRVALAEFMVAFAKMDVRCQLEAMVRFGAIPPQHDLDLLTAEIEAEVSPHDLSEEADIKELADAIGRLIKVLSRHGIRIPKELVLFFKNLLYLNGFAATVAPDAALLAQVAPVFAYFHDKYGHAMDLSSLAP